MYSPSLFGIFMLGSLAPGSLDFLAILKPCQKLATCYSEVREIYRLGGQILLPSGKERVELGCGDLGEKLGTCVCSLVWPPCKFVTIVNFFLRGSHVFNTSLELMLPYQLKLLSCIF